MMCKIIKLFIILTIFSSCSVFAGSNEEQKALPKLPVSRPHLDEKQQEIVESVPESTKKDEQSSTEATKKDTKTETFKSTETPARTASVTTKTRLKKRPAVTVLKNEFVNMRDGAYEHYLELSDETIHKEIGKFENGEFIVVGYFLYPEDKQKMHIYVKDKTGLNYYIKTITEGLDEYLVEEEEGDICSVTGSSCIDTRVLNSLIG